MSVEMFMLKICALDTNPAGSFVYTLLVGVFLMKPVEGEYI